MTGKTRRSIFGIVLIVAAALSGCGGVAEPDDALTGAAVLQATRDAGTARVSMSSTLSADNFSVTVEGSGVEDFAQKSGSMKVKQKSKGEFPQPPRQPGDEPGLEIKGGESPLENNEFEARWFGDVSYTTGFTLGMFGNKKWIKFDVGELTDDEDCPTPASPLGLGAATPINALDVLAANGNVLEDLGTEVVRDEATTHWRIEDPKAPPGCEDEEIGKVILELWTDTDKRARRILVTIEPANTATSSTTSVDDWEPPLRFTMTTDYFDFGVPVSIEEPPKNEVWDTSDTTLTDPQPADYGAPGPWTVVAEGTRAGSPWRVWTTKTSTGVRCYDGENTNPGPIASLIPNEDAPQHNGRPTVCDIGPDSVLMMFGGFRALADVTEGGQRTIVGTVTGDKAQLVFADGTTVAMTVDPETHIGQWRGAAPAGTVKIKTEAGGCQLGFDLSDVSGDPPDMNAVTDAVKNGEVPCIGSESGIVNGIPLPDGAGVTGSGSSESLEITVPPLP